MKAAPLVVAVGGLLLAGGTVSDWVVRDVSREVGGVPLTQTEGMAGTAFAAWGLPLGLAAVAASLALLAGGAVRRAAGFAAALLGVVAMAAVAIGGVRAAGEPGGLGAGLPAAAAGAVAVGAGGIMALARSTPPRLGARYTVDGGDGDEEWRLAAPDDEDRR